MTSRNSDDSVQNRQKSRAWGALILAGGFEVGYALSVNGSQGFTNLAWSLIAFSVLPVHTILPECRV